MRSVPRRGLMLPLILPFMLLVLQGCVAGPSIYATPSACSSLLPDQWKAGLRGAPLPSSSRIGDWISFADAQTGQLDKANGRTADAIGIIERCEARDRAAIAAARKRWWQFWK